MKAREEFVFVTKCPCCNIIINKKVRINANVKIDLTLDEITKANTKGNEK